MYVLGDLIARERRSDRPALRVPALDRRLSYRDVCATAAKVGNFLSYLGVRRGGRVAVAPDPRPEPVAALLGAALLGAVTRFDARTPEARVVVASRSREGEVDLPPGGRLVVYGDPPSSSTVFYWERDVWSENPAFPSGDVSSENPALAVDGGAYSHETLLSAARRTAATVDLDDDDAVAVRAPLSHPGVVVAGVLAPLSVGAAVLFPDGESVGTVAVSAAADAPEPTVVRPEESLRSPE